MSILRSEDLSMTREEMLISLAYERANAKELEESLTNALDSNFALAKQVNQLREDQSLLLEEVDDLKGQIATLIDPWEPHSDMVVPGEDEGLKPGDKVRVVSDPYWMVPGGNGTPFYHHHFGGYDRPRVGDVMFAKEPADDDDDYAVANVVVSHVDDTGLGGYYVHPDCLERVDE